MENQIFDKSELGPFEALAPSSDTVQGKGKPWQASPNLCLLLNAFSFNKKATFAW